MKSVSDFLKVPDTFTFSALYNSAGEGFNVANFAAKMKKQRECGESVIDRQVAYQTTQSNVVVERSFMFNNLKVTKVPMERKGLGDQYPMSPEYLSDIFQRDKDAGLCPTVFLATIGTTASIGIDPIRDISKACKEHGIWLHIDLAHLGVFKCLPELQDLFDGMELGDSISINGHKIMGLGEGSSFFWAQTNIEDLISYETEPEFSEGMLNAHVCEAKQARALRCYLAMHLNGGEDTRTHLREVMRLVNIAKKTLQSDPRFEVLETASTTCLIDFRPAGVTNEQTN